VKLMPIVYVTEMGRAIDFYTALGLQAHHADRSGMWTELSMGDAVLALHRVPVLPNTADRRMELAFVCTEPLEALTARLKAASVPLERDIADEAFGRSILLRDPDGMLIQINEHDLELYT
jgi:catechol 2,3-dioxygenase-like lactoylglutathione lyase family enzyme